MKHRNDRLDVDANTFEVLKNFGSRERYSGVVETYDRAGTTIFIASGDRRFLAFADPSLQPGDAVSFRIDGLRAKDIKKILKEKEQYAATK